MGTETQYKEHIIEEYTVDKEPYYVPVGDEVSLFHAAFEEKMPILFKGPTGCGKTSLLMALLGEMTLIKGKVFLPGGYSREDVRPDPETGLTESVAYCAQQAWLVNANIKENILFYYT